MLREASGEYTNGIQFGALLGGLAPQASCHGGSLPITMVSLPRL